MRADSALSNSSLRFRQDVGYSGVFRRPLRDFGGTGCPPKDQSPHAGSASSETQQPYAEKRRLGFRPISVSLLANAGTLKWAKP